MWGRARGFNSDEGRTYKSSPQRLRRSFCKESDCQDAPGSTLWCRLIPESLTGFGPESASVLDQVRGVRWTRKAVFHATPRFSFLSFQSLPRAACDRARFGVLAGSGTFACEADFLEEHGARFVHPFDRRVVGHAQCVRVEG